MAADRGAFIDQSQSFNVHIAEPNFGKLTSMHFYAWKKVREQKYNNKYYYNTGYCKATVFYAQENYANHLRDQNGTLKKLA